MVSADRCNLSNAVVYVGLLELTLLWALSCIWGMSNSIFNSVTREVVVRAVQGLLANTAAAAAAAAASTDIPRLWTAEEQFAFIPVFCNSVANCVDNHDITTGASQLSIN
jgi:hypothetical protein